MTAGKPALNIVEEMKTPQGVLWVQTDKIPYRNQKGEIIGIIGFTTDITERKRGEEALRESEEKFQKAFRAAPAMMGITLIDEGRFVDVNEKFLSVTGYARKAIIGHTSLELKLYADCRQREQMLAQIQAQGKCKDMECELCTRTGEIRLCLMSAEVILLRGERHLLTIVNDITARKKTEEALRENENRLRFALEGTNDGLWDVQMKTGAVYLSPRGCEILGYGTAGLPDVIKKWDQLVHPDDLPATNERLQAHLAGHAPIFEVEQRLRTKSGDWKWILARGKVVIRDARGQPLRMTGTHSDISERKEMQAKLLASEKLAVMGRLVADVAHEINNPLSIIMLGTQQLERMIKKQGNAIPDSEDKARMLEKIKNGTNRCKKIVASLLVSTRPTTLDIKPADVKQLIEEALESMDDRLKSQNVKVVKTFASRLPIIDADGHRLGQVFINIITNACDAMPEGGKLMIATRLYTPEAGRQGVAAGQEGPTIEIEISDTGEGIGEDDIFKIFDPFVTTKKDGKGVGLGLSISSGIVREHGGDIAVTSKKGKGATFIIRLPAKRAQAG